MVRKTGIALVLLATGIRLCAAAAPLPYQSAGRHLGVATCATSVCHGSVIPSSGHDVALNEFVTWSHDDRHSQAYAALTSDKGRTIATRLGIPDARSAAECLGCHTDNVAASRRGPGFTVSDGVSCEACHGGAEPWLATHSARTSTYRQNVSRGMYPTADLHERAALCLSCHAGNEDKFATHRIMGAGHPRLSFELDTFLALQPPHYQIDADYAKRKPTYSRTRVWVHGQLAAALRDMQFLQGPLMQKSGLMPELALLDCHACHENPLHRQDWNRGLLTRLLPPGSVPFPEGHLKMAIVVARRLDDGLARALIERAQRLQKSSAEDNRTVISSSAALAQTLSRVIELADSHQWTHEDSGLMLREIVRLGATGECTDYISAEQAVMASELLMIETDLAASHRTTLDELYRILRSDDAYQPSRLRDQMAALASQLTQ